MMGHELGHQENAEIELIRKNPSSPETFDQQSKQQTHQPVFPSDPIIIHTRPSTASTENKRKENVNNWTYQSSITKTPSSSPAIASDSYIVNESSHTTAIDLDVQIAAEALGSLSKAVVDQSIDRDNVYQQETTSNLVYITQDQHQMDSTGHFMQRVTNIPLVNQSLTQIGAAYEATKNYSRMVKYSAETVESSVRSISKPVFETVAPALAPLDRFACNQLDRLEKSFPTIIGQQHQQNIDQIQVLENSRSSQEQQFVEEILETSGEPKRMRTYSIESNRSIPMSINTESNISWPSSPKFSSEQSSLPSTIASSPVFHVLSNYPSMASSTGAISSSTVHVSLPSSHVIGIRNQDSQLQAVTKTAPHIDRKPRSRWSQVVANVGGNFGSMVISDEMMRGLRYCLRWLQYATAKVDRQIAVLVNYLTRLVGQNQPATDEEMDVSHDSSQPTPPLSPYRNQHLVASGQGNADLMAVVRNIKNDIVNTLKKVVDVIGQYAAAYLPYEARRRVKGFILALPNRWQHINSAESGNSTAAPGTPENEAQRVLSLATESSNMLKSVSTVFSQSVEGAEMVLGRSSESFPRESYPHQFSSEIKLPTIASQSSAFPSVTTLTNDESIQSKSSTKPAKYDPKDEDKMDTST